MGSGARVRFWGGTNLILAPGSATAGRSSLPALAHAGLVTVNGIADGVEGSRKLGNVWRRHVWWLMVDGWRIGGVIRHKEEE